MLYSQLKQTYLKEFPHKTLSEGANEESPSLHVIDNHHSASETILTQAEKDATLVTKVHLILDEHFDLLSPEDANQNIAIQSSDEKYEYLAEYGTQILCLLTADYNCSYLSRNFSRLTEQPAENYLGEKFSNLIHSDFHDKFYNSLKHSSETSSKPQTIRIKMRHGDGKFQWYQSVIHRKEKQYICLIENIHEDMQVQNSLQKAKLEAELALRARSEFLAGMSHELRTPLNAVIGFSQIMEKGMFGEIGNPQYLEYIRYIQDSGHELLTKIEDLLEIANIDAGRVSLEREEVAVSDLVKAVIKNQAALAGNAKVSVSYVPKGDILLFVDRLKIQHILGHLLTNAVKFNRPGGEATIEIGREVDKEGKSSLRISVHDNGVGMPDLKCHDIRESLRQENCWTAKNSNHIGIGLALTKEFATLHGGSVTICSSVGIGTTVSILLPRDCIRIGSSKHGKKQLENG